MIMKRSDGSFDEKPVNRASSSDESFDEKPVKSVSSVANQTFDEESAVNCSPKYRVDYDERPIKSLDTKLYYTVTEDNRIDEITEPSNNRSVEDFKSPSNSLAGNSEKKNDLSSTEDSNSSKLSEQEFNSDDDVIIAFKEPVRSYKVTSRKLDPLKDKRRTFVIGKQPAVPEASPSLDCATTPSDHQVSYSENMNKFTTPNLDFLPANATYLCTPSQEVASQIRETVSFDNEEIVEKSKEVPALNLSIEESPKMESRSSARTSKSLIVDSCESTLNESSMDIFPRNKKKENVVKLIAKEVTKELSGRDKKKLNEIKEDDNSLVIVNRAATRKRGKTVVQTEPDIKINKKGGSDNKSKKKKEIQEADAERPSNEIVEDTQSRPKEDSQDAIGKPTKEPLKKSRKKKDIKEAVAISNVDVETPSNVKVKDTQSKAKKDSQDAIGKPKKEPLKKSRVKIIGKETDPDVAIIKAKKEPPKKSRKKKVNEENEIINSVDGKLKSEDTVSIDDKTTVIKINQPTTEPSKKLRKVEDSVAISNVDTKPENNCEENPAEHPKKRGRKPAAKKNQLSDKLDSKVGISKKEEVNMDTEENDLDTELIITNSEDLRTTGRRKKQVNYCELTPSSKPKRVALHETKEVKSVDIEVADQETASASNMIKPNTQRGRNKIIVEDDNEEANVQGTDTKTKATKGGRKKKTAADNKPTDASVVIPEKRGRIRAVNEVDEEESPPKSRKIEIKPAGKARKAKVEKSSAEIETCAPRGRRVLRR